MPKIHQKKPSIFCTVWKFHDFCITQILREINFEESRSAKSAILTHSRLRILILMHFCTFWRLQFTKWTKFTALKVAKTAIFALSESSKLISRKIWVIQKSWNCYTVPYCIFKDISMKWFFKECLFTWHFAEDFNPNVFEVGKFA